MPADKITSFEDLVSALSDEPQCKEFVIHQISTGLNLIHLTEEQPPTISAVICIDKSLKVKLYQNQQILPMSVYSHIVSCGTVSLFSQVTNLMAFARNLSPKPSVSQVHFQENLTNLSEAYMEKSENDQEIRLLKFLLEQVDLLFKSRTHRRYSPDLLLLSYTLHSTSAKAYDRLLEEKLLILPSAWTLKKITMNLHKQTGIDDSKYLRMRYSKLNAFDVNVLLMIDEIYVSKRVEATAGQVFGLTEDCEVAATALCFMIKSLASGYRDMVGIFPIRNLRAKT